VSVIIIMTKAKFGEKKEKEKSYVHDCFSINYSYLMTDLLLNEPQIVIHS